MHRPYSLNFLIGICLFHILLWSCGGKKEYQPPPPKDLTLLQVQDYPAFSDDMDYDGLTKAIDQSLVYFNRLPEGQTLIFGEESYSVVDMRNAMEMFKHFIAAHPSEATLKQYVSEHFRVYSAGSTEANAVQFTGYYEPLLQGSRSPSETFPYPVYGKPKDIVTVDLSPFSEDFKNKKIVGRWTGDTLVPYYDRKEIDFENALEGIAPVLLWVSDPTSLFFLHIQGSGKAILENGQIVNLQYHAVNGRPYVAIGGILADEGKIPREELSMQSIRSYLHEHPEEKDALFIQNPSYVFFRESTEECPKGAINVTLTPGRSIATDLKIFPKGALSFVRTAKPLVDENGAIVQWEPFSRFVLNQDTGGAIRGAHRADFFWGNGSYAEIAAGHMNQTGEMYFLSPIISSLKETEKGTPP